MYTAPADPRSRTVTYQAIRKSQQRLVEQIVDDVAAGIAAHRAHADTDMTDRCSSSIRAAAIASNIAGTPDHPQVVVDLQASQPITGYRQLPVSGWPAHHTTCGRCQMTALHRLRGGNAHAGSVSTPLSNSACSITGRADKNPYRSRRRGCGR